jgi:hypothetical protein
MHTSEDKKFLTPVRYSGDGSDVKNILANNFYDYVNFGICCDYKRSMWTKTVFYQFLNSNQVFDTNRKMLDDIMFDYFSNSDHFNPLSFPKVIMSNEYQKSPITSSIVHIILDFAISYPKTAQYCIPFYLGCGDLYADLPGSRSFSRRLPLFTKGVLSRSFYYRDPEHVEILDQLLESFMFAIEWGLMCDNMFFEIDIQRYDDKIRNRIVNTITHANKVDKLRSFAMCIPFMNDVMLLTIYNNL